MSDEPVTMETLMRRILDADVVLRDAVNSGAPVWPLHRASNVRTTAIRLIDTVTVHGGDLFGASVYVGQYELMACDLRAAYCDPQPDDHSPHWT